MKLLIVERDVPLPGAFMNIVRSFGRAYGILDPLPSTAPETTQMTQNGATGRMKDKLETTALKALQTVQDSTWISCPIKQWTNSTTAPCKCLENTGSFYRKCCGHGLF